MNVFKAPGLGWLRKIIEERRARPFSIALEFPVHPIPRYGYGRPVHARLAELMNEGRSGYRSLLESFLSFQPDLWKIGSRGDDTRTPIWINGFLPGLDAVSLYSLIRLNQPRRYVEIGSGHSTRFARRAIDDAHLKTEIVSVDPHPRVEIRAVADRVIEQPVEEMALDIFESLHSGDILFVDCSHRVFTNSDTTVVFLDIIPKLHAGVLVHFHDIFLPADYPPEWNDRYYSEQYLLACHLLAQTKCFEILLPNNFVSADPELSSIVAGFWLHPAMAGVEKHGTSFWVRVMESRP
jgi:predicted O-methyltransferase YrrM